MTMLGLRSHSRGLGLSSRRSGRAGARTGSLQELIVTDGIASELTFGIPTADALAELVVANGIASGVVFSVPTVDAVAELIVANGIPSGTSFGAPTVGAPAELVVANGIASGVTFGSPTIESLPTIRVQNIQGRAAADPHNVTTSGFGWVSADLVLAFTGISGTTTLSSLAGLTDDTYTQLTSVLPGSHDHRQYLHRGTVNGGAFDATTRWDLSGSRAIVLALLSIIGGHSTLDASSTNFGTGGALPSVPAITTTGPNRLIIAVATIRGAHVSNPPSALRVTPWSATPSRGATAPTRTPKAQSLSLTKRSQPRVRLLRRPGVVSVTSVPNPGKPSTSRSSPPSLQRARPASPFLPKSSGATWSASPSPPWSNQLMANSVYPKFKEYALNVALGGGAQKTGTLKAALVTSGYTYNAAHDFRDDLGANVVGTPTAVASPTFTDGVLDGGDVTFNAVSGSAVASIVVYLDTSGADSTDPLVCYIDTGVTGLPVTPNGGDIKVTWSNGSAKIFAL